MNQHDGEMRRTQRWMKESGKISNGALIGTGIALTTVLGGALFFNDNDKPEEVTMGTDTKEKEGLWQSITDFLDTEEAKKLAKDIFTPELAEELSKGAFRADEIRDFMNKYNEAESLGAKVDCLLSDNIIGKSESLLKAGFPFDGEIDATSSKLRLTLGEEPTPEDRDAADMVGLFFTPFSKIQSKSVDINIYRNADNRVESIIIHSEGMCQNGICTIELPVSDIPGPHRKAAITASNIIDMIPGTPITSDVNHIEIVTPVIEGEEQTPTYENVIITVEIDVEDATRKAAFIKEVADSLDINDVKKVGAELTEQAAKASRFWQEVFSK